VAGLLSRLRPLIGVDDPEHFGARFAVAFSGSVTVIGVAVIAWIYRGRIDPPDDRSIDSVLTPPDR
jgi:hypothetical protein